MLEHLILVPVGGLCNRLRAIASGRRLCQRKGAKCSIVWDWGDYWQFFAPAADLDVLRFTPLCAPRSRRMNGTDNRERAVDVNQSTIKVRGGVLFWGSDERRIRIRDLVPLVPRLHPRLQAAADEFARERLARAVGFHMRRTDHQPAIDGSPDSLFVEEAERVISAGNSVFLATDNTATEQMMTARFGKSVITHPRRKVLAQRWPRLRFDAAALEDDLLDLFLLARTQYVVGCHYSSFSALAMALNGSRECRKLVLPEAKLRAA